MRRGHVGLARRVCSGCRAFCRCALVRRVEIDHAHLRLAAIGRFTEHLAPQPATAAPEVVEPKREITATSDGDSPVVKGASHGHKSGSSSNAAKTARTDKPGAPNIAPPRRPKKVAAKPARNEDL